MAFVTVPQQTFMVDVLKTLLKTVQDAVPSAKVVPKHPDINEALKLPVVVLTRVSDETMVLARNSGFFGYTAGATSSSLERLEGYRYHSQYQLDILSRSNTEMLTLVGQLQGKLLDPQGDNFFAEGYPLQWQEIPVLHFADVSSAGTDTDLRIRYKYKEVSGTQVEGFDNEILQYSMTVPVWCDYMKGREIDKVLLIGNITNQ